ncbi:MAG: hypothetical protein IJU26_02695 [Synergistaceae bacterium]|nr:hypothetical protein [Synergistaceae bacterium]
MKYRILAVLAFAGVLAVSGAAFAKENDPNNPFKSDPFGEMQRVREKHETQEEQKKWPPVVKPGTGRWPDRTKDDYYDRKPIERPKDDRYGRRPPEKPKDDRNDKKHPERPKDGVRPNRPPEKPKDDRRDDRPHPLPRDGHKRKVPPEYKN